MEFRIKNYKAYVNSDKFLTEWWTVQRLFGVVWVTARKAVPYGILNEVIRFTTKDKAQDYIEEQLAKTKKFRIISEII